MKFQRKTQNKTATTSKSAKAKAVAHSLTENQKKEVALIMKGKAETKYAVSDRGGSFVYTPVYGEIAIGPFVGSTQNLYPAMPEIGTGVESNQRIGQKISNVKVRTHFNFTWSTDNTNTGSFASNAYYVRVYALKSRQVKYGPLVNSLTPGTLLDLGTAQTTDWNPTAYTAPQLGMMPISRENFTGHYKTFLMVKNQGLINQDATQGVTPNLGTHQFVNHTEEWTHSGNCLYDDQRLFPSNFAPFYTFVAWDATLPLSIPARNPTPIVVNVRTEVFYKDE